MSAAWHHDAACVGMDTSIFVPRTDVPERLALLWPAAREVCNSCPVKAECLAAALREEGPRSRASRFGMRGGATPDERARLASGRAIVVNGHIQARGTKPPAACGTPGGYRRHVARKTEPCDACRASEREYRRGLRRRRSPEVAS